MEQGSTILERKSRKTSVDCNNKRFEMQRGGTWKKELNGTELCGGENEKGGGGVVC